MKQLSCVGLIGVLLGAGTALAAPSPQQLCDGLRITAWKKYASCVEMAVAKDAGCPPNLCASSFDLFAAFAKCRHAYFKKWATFQKNASLATSSCRPGGGARFVNNLDGTVTDGLTGLVWEQKTNLDFATNFSDPHDADNYYSWSTAANNEDGTAFTNFLGTLNGGGGFAGANGWRLPTLVELQTIVRDFACTGTGGGLSCNCSSNPSNPCIDQTFTSTSANAYWSATTYVPQPGRAWDVLFDLGAVGQRDKGPVSHSAALVRAVRGGL